MRDGDDGVIHRGKSSRGTPDSVGTSQGSTDSKVSTLAPEIMPWLLPERLLASLSGRLILTINILYLLRPSYMGLIAARRTFVLRRIFTSMLFSSIDGTIAITNETLSR